MSGGSCDGRRGNARNRHPGTRWDEGAGGRHAMNVRLYVLQRATALIMVPLVLLHLAVIFYAARAGLSAADILARTRGSIGWAAFYAVFVLAAATHGAIGVRSVAADWAGVRGGRLDILTWGFGMILAALGLRAVAAVVLP